MKHTALFILFSIISVYAMAQGGPGAIRGLADRFRNVGSGGGSGSIERRNKFEDSITISYRYLDTTRSFKLDSSINDFYLRYPLPVNHYNLGNTGSATQSYLFSPIMEAGFDQGLHAFDAYKFTTDKARFFRSTRQYSEINYVLSSRSEQFIDLMHTQNIKPNWNAHLEYKFISAPGFLNGQKNSHSSYLVTSWYQSINKRYSNFFIVAANKLQATEGGGMDESHDYLNDPEYFQRLYIPSKIPGSNVQYGGNVFNTQVLFGNKYNTTTMLLRQQYDIGKKDSLVLDTLIVPLFFPRLRFEHTLTYSKDIYNYSHPNANTSDYSKAYGISTLPDFFSTIGLKDSWKQVVNDFSIYTFPDAKNTQQYIKAGAAVQNLFGSFDTAIRKNYVNIYGHGEYRNRTRNQKWDLLAYGKLYFAGMNIGDYEARASIESMLGKKIGSLQLGFENVNKSPSFITNPLSGFYLMKEEETFKKQNITRLYAHVYQPILKLNLTGSYYLLNNYIYFTDYFKINQTSTLFNVLQLNANKVFEVGRKKQWKWRADVYFQQIIGNAPLNLPLIYTRNRIGYEGNLGYPKLNIAFGVESFYRTPYKANRYSPLVGQFFLSDSVVRYSMPDLAAYVNFRINSLKAFIRAENLNSFSQLGTHWGFYNYNSPVPAYPYPGLTIRVGIFWGFVN